VIEQKKYHNFFIYEYQMLKVIFLSVMSSSRRRFSRVVWFFDSIRSGLPLLSGLQLLLLKAFFRRCLSRFHWSGYRCGSGDREIHWATVKGHSYI